jgi:hypothetical protein
MLVADLRGPTMFARIGVMRALKPRASAPIIIVWMNPGVGRDLSLFRELDHVDRRRVSRCPAGSAFERRVY